MHTTLFFYTATGNSLVLARTVAAQLGDAEVVPIARFRTARTAPKSARVGILFPIHAWGPPRTVSEFVQNLDLADVRYTFAIASCGGTAGGALPNLRKALRKNGGELHAGFIVRSQGYMASTGKENPMIAMVRGFSGKPFAMDHERLPEILEVVKNERRIGPERSALVGSMLGNLFHSKAETAFASLDASYVVGESCKSCGTCGRICPRGNVFLEDGKPAWHHDCDFCGACATWCPNQAIGMKVTPASARGHNPQVKAVDLIWA
jgi:ferredoxin/flavodoxin